ncbi:Crp/Fnr family transcriptional regulator [Hoeflea sp.]|uniref:Crp/Fnr family transcriptional regulator n=1 Tax=Hoeflea sp. TaxID=1940281 RepID=UPI0025BCEB13|nr:Crp/Fnr family transcriptional regulator [Hoeflea sp.]
MSGAPLVTGTYSDRRLPEYDFNHIVPGMLPSPFHLLPSSASTSRTLRKGAALFHRNDPATAMYHVRTGQVHLLRHTSQGDEVVIHRVDDDESFAEAALFSPVYHCGAVAAADTELVRIDKASILERMQQDPDFAIAISARFAGQIQNYRRRLEIVAIRDARSRVFAAVADGIFASQVKAGAAQIGLTHEAVYRALSSLVRAGRLIKTGRGRYRLPD